MSAISDKLQTAGEDRKRGIMEFLNSTMADLAFLSKLPQMVPVFDLVESGRGTEQAGSIAGKKGEAEIRSLLKEKTRQKEK